MSSTRPVKKAIVTLITNHRAVLMVEKTKSRAEGGKQVVSVGPYKQAVGGSSYAVIGKLLESRSTDPFAIADDFISFVGRQKAWEVCCAYNFQNGLNLSLFRNL